MFVWACCMPQNTVLLSSYTPNVKFHTFIHCAPPHPRGMNSSAPPSVWLKQPHATSVLLSFRHYLLCLIDKVKRAANVYHYSLSHSPESLSSSKLLFGFTHSLLYTVLLTFFFFVYSAFLCHWVGPLDRSLISSGGTRQCDSLGFITHEYPGISSKSGLYCTWVLYPV